MVFPIGLKAETLLGFLSSSVSSTFNSFLSPTLSFEVGDVAKIPFLLPKNDKLELVTTRVKQLIKLSKTDWDSQETSWDFKRNPLV